MLGRMKFLLRSLLAAGAVTAIAVGASGCGNSTSADANVPPVQPAPATTTTDAKPPTPAVPAGSTAVKGSVDEYSVKVSPVTAPAGKVTFVITNSGNIPHEFVVLKTSKPADQLGTGMRIPETGHVGEIGGLAPGQTKSVTLDLKPGHYSLVCNIPAHYKMGMHADFTVS